MEGLHRLKLKQINIKSFLIKPMSQCKQWTYGISKESTNEVVNMFWILTNLQLSKGIAKVPQIRLFNKCVLHFIASFFLSTVTLTLVMWPQIGWSSFFLGIDSFFLMWNSSRGGCDSAVWPRLLLKVIHEQFPKMSKNANKRSSGENALYHF